MPPAKNEPTFRTITIRLDEDTLEAAAELLEKQIDRAQRVTAAAARELELDETTKDKRTAALAIVKELARAGRLAELAGELRSGWDAAGDPALEAARYLQNVDAGTEPRPANREEFVKNLRAQADLINAADPLDPNQPTAPSELGLEPDAAEAALAADEALTVEPEAGA